MSDIVSSHVMFHPKERRLWVLDFKANALLAVDGDTVSEIASGEKLVSGSVEHDVNLNDRGLYFDTVRERPILWVSTFRRQRVLDLFVHDGTSFVPLAQTAGVAPASSDAFAFDPVRGVLVHFLGKDDTRPQQDGAAVREMDETGTWNDGRVVEPSLTGNLFAGWDEARSRLIVFDLKQSVAYDGRSFTAVGKVSSYPFKPYAMALTPDARRLVFLQRKAWTTETKLSILEDTGWKFGETNGLAGFEGGAFDPVHDRTVFWKPSYGVGHHQRMFVALKQDRLEPVGPTLWDLDRGTATAGPAVFSGVIHSLSPSPEEEQAFAVPRLAAVRGDQLVALPTLAAPLLSLASYPEGTYAISWRCEIFQLAGDAWQRIAEAPPELSERSEANVAWHPTRVEATMVGGRLVADRFGPIPTDTWRWRLQPGAWEKLQVTGKPAVRGQWEYPGSGAGIDGDSDEMVFLGGKLRSLKENEKTWICDGKKWKSFPTTFEGNEPMGPFLMAWDPGSRQMLLFGRARRSEGEKDLGWYLSVHAHRGEGRWQFARWLEKEGEAIAFSGSERVLYQFHREGAFNTGSYRLVRAPIDLPAAPAAKGKATPKQKEAPAPVAPAVWLRYQDDESDKFWFASLAGEAFTARWGRRGAKEQSKTQSFASAELARKAYEKIVRAKLGEGYEHAPEGESAAHIPGLNAWHFSQPVKGGEDAFRGPPPLLADNEWPTCGCGARTTYVLTFRAHPERLPLKHAAAVGLFICFKCDPDDESRSKGVIPLREEVLPKRKKTDLGFKYQRVFEADTEIEDNASGTEAVSKVGGRPAWLETDEPPPNCSVCHVPMRFIAQLDTLDDEVDFGGGMAYVFLCADEHEGRWLLRM